MANETSKCVKLISKIIKLVSKLKYCTAVGKVTKQ